MMKNRTTGNKIYQGFRRINIEVIFWLAGLLYLAFSDPYTGGHFSFCVFKLIGIDYCPGCGLGHSISFLFHGDLAGSFNAHPLGCVAVGILTFRIISLIRKSFIGTVSSTETI